METSTLPLELGGGKQVVLMLSWRCSVKGGGAVVASSDSRAVIWARVVYDMTPASQLMRASGDLCRFATHLDDRRI